MPTGQDIEERVEMLLRPQVAGLSFDLLEAQWVFSDGRQILRLLVDGPKGVNLDDCGKISRMASLILDVEDFIPGGFSLEVSSPGMFRKLRTLVHYQQSLGKIIRVNLVPGVLEGVSQVRGCLKEIKEETLVVTREGEGAKQGQGEKGKESTEDGEGNENVYEIPFSGVSKGRLDPDL